jgi:hypothetical protein
MRGDIYCQMGWKPRWQGQRLKRKTPSASGRREIKYVERKRN